MAYSSKSGDAEIRELNSVAPILFEITVARTIPITSPSAAISSPIITPVKSDLYK